MACTDQVDHINDLCRQLIESDHSVYTLQEHLAKRAHTLDLDGRHADASLMIQAADRIQALESIWSEEGE